MAPSSTPPHPPPPQSKAPQTNAPQGPILALDTSTQVYSVGLYSADLTAIGQGEAKTSQQDDALLPLIDQVLGQAGVALRDLAAVACGAGPGSFTGLRIGLATAKGLCFAAERPLLLISSLAALASDPLFGQSVVVACLDARKGEIFAGAYAPDPRDGKPVPVRPPVAISPDDLPDVYAEVASGAGAPPRLVGNAVTTYPALGALGPWTVATPTAAGVARLAWPRWLRGETDDLFASTPTYVRAPEIYPQPAQSHPIAQPPQRGTENAPASK